MQSLKTLGLLLLLIMSNTGIASAYNISLPHFQENKVDFHFTEDQQDLSESTLITPAEVQTNRTLIPVALIPEQMCPRKITRENRYLLYSSTIVPSLDITDIIFPFHSFL